MKIAYVSYNQMHAIANGGVGRKIRGVVETWHAAGHQAQWFLTTSAEVSGEEVSAFRFDVGKRSLGREIDRSRQLAHMVHAVKAYQPDVIYLRAGIYTYPLQRLFRIAPVVMELNTIDVIEYKMQGALRYFVHRLTRDFVFRKAAGFVAVSYEIGNHFSNTKYNKPIQVFSNGIDLRGFDPFPAPDNQVPHLVYMGAPDNSWQGLDKLLSLADACPDFKFDVIGSSPKDFIGQSIPPNVQLHGFLDREAYEPILARADVGVGTLALHRKGMDEASTLKVREYLAYGLPLLLAYQETDFIGKEFDFVLQIPNTEENVFSHVERIRKFSFEMQGKRAERDLIAPLIDIIQKQERLLAFLKSLCE